MTLPTIPPAAARALGAPTLRSTQRFRLELRRGLTPLTGQTTTFTRASTATMTDSAGASVTVGHSRPRLEARTWSGQSELGLRMTTDDLTATWNVACETSTWLIEAINLGTATTNTAGLLAVGRDDLTGARLMVRGTGSTLEATWTTSAGVTSVATFGASLANGDAVQLLVQLEDDGTNQRVRIGGTKNGATVTTSAWGTARARSADYGSGSVVRLNRVGSSGTQGNVWLRALAYAPGLLTVADLSGVL